MKLNLPVLFLTIGILLRLLSVAFMDVQQDGNAYATMGHELASTGHFLMPWGDGLGSPTTPSYSHHYPPLYPAYLAAWYRMAGFTVQVTKTANLDLSLAAILVVYTCTRNLYGKTTAAYTAGLFAVMPRFIMAAGTGFSENIVAIVFTATLWAGLRGLKEPHYLILAGLFAGLAFLTRSGMGPFFFIGIAAGLLWRIKYQGTKGTFTNTPYLLGGAAFVLLAGWWSLRNYRLFGDWQSSSYLTWATTTAFHYPAYIAGGWLFKFAQYSLILYLFLASFRKEWQEAWKQRSLENVSILWLSIGLVYGLGILISGIIWAVERSPPFWMDSERYLAMAYVPLLWLLFKDLASKVKWRNFHIRYAALAIIFCLVATYELVEPTQSPEDHAATALTGIIHSGDTLGVMDGEQGLGRYSFYPYLAAHDNVSLVLCSGPSQDPCHGATPKVILGVLPMNDPHYSVIRVDQLHSLFFGSGKAVKTYLRNP